MKRQTEEQAIRQAVDKCPYKKICKSVNFSKKEIEYIVEELTCTLESTRFGGSKDSTINEIINCKEEDFDLKEKEITMIKGIFSKFAISEDDNCEVEDE